MRSFSRTALIAGLAALGAALASLPESAHAQTKTIGVLPARIQKEMAQGRRYALLIGIGKCQDKRIPKLDYTAADAKAMYAVLTDPSHGRFAKERVKLLLDEKATAKNIRRHFTWLRRNARAEDMVVVFYSGHGAPEGKRTYWVPYDAEIDDLDATAIPNDYITRRLAAIRAKRLITFLDSCYSAAIAEKEDKPKALFDQDFFKKFQGAGRVTITASDGQELSLESKDLRQGVFTHYLVQALKGKADTNGDGAVELEEVWAHVRKRVTDEAMKRGNRQRPQLIGSLSAGFLVSLNPGMVQRFGEQKKHLLELLGKKRITAVEYEEAMRVLDGEGAARMLPIVRDLADGKLAPRYYRSARAEALRGKGKPSPASPSLSTGSDRVASLLRKAEGQMSLNRLTSPKGESAYDTLREVLRAAPGHPEAIRRLRAIVKKYKAWARKRMAANDWNRAEQFLLSARKVTGEDPEVDDLLTRVRQGSRQGRERVEREKRRREAEARQERAKREVEGRETRARLARLERERREREKRALREKAKLEEERRRLQEEGRRFEEERKRREARLKRERTLRVFEGVWRVERSRPRKTRAAPHKPYNERISYTLTFRVEGSGLRGSYRRSSAHAYARGLRWVWRDSRTGRPCGRANRISARRSFQGSLRGGRTVSFASWRSAEILEDTCHDLAKYGVKSLLNILPSGVRLSADGRALRLKGVRWSAVLRGGDIVLRKVR